MSSRCFRFQLPSFGCMLAVWLCGCVAGPRALEISRTGYNEAIQKTREEQMLLNLVRLQYREEPLFLNVGTVAAQFAFKGSADGGANIQEGPSPNPLRFDLGAGFVYEERPTITLTPLQGKDFAQRLLAPLDLEVILWLSRSGWSIDRVLRLTVQEINGLDNASRASGPTPADPPRYEAFARVSALMRDLQKQGMLRVGYEARSADLGVPLPRERVSLADVMAAASRGYGLRASDDGENVVLTGSSRVLVWTISPEALETAEVREIVDLLCLAPGRSSYEIRLGLSDQAEPSASSGNRTAITIMTRSLMGAMFYLSQAIEVPQRHRDKGFVTTTRDSGGLVFDWGRVTGDLLKIRSQRTPPSEAAVAVRHWEYWYHVDNADLRSKSTLALLGQLFALQAGSAATAAPTLTLPVGG